MKRDIDYCRQLLADLEGRGPESPLRTMRPGVGGEADERLRHHVRLLIDAGLVKETDRTAASGPCVRLTNAGHEFLELAHSEARWREAKWLVQERTGGLSLAVLRAVLTRWAVEAAVHGERWRPRPHHTHLAATPLHRIEPRYADRRYADPVYRFERDVLADDPWRRSGPSREAYLERFDWRDRSDRDRYAHNGFYYDGPVHDGLSREWDTTADGVGVSLPIHVV